jgi:hyperosmotically inducible protein
MTTLRCSVAVITMFAVATLVGCAGTTQKSPDVASSIRKSLDQAGLTSISISQDRDKGIVTLGGQVATEGEKMQAEELAKSLAGTQVVAVQIAVVPVGREDDAKTVNADLDRGIEQNLHAALVQNQLRDAVKFSVKNAVVTLTGDVMSQAVRDDAGMVAGGVPYVKQVVNSLQIGKQKATSSK